MPIRSRTSFCHEPPSRRKSGTSTTVAPSRTHHAMRLKPRLGSVDRSFRIPADSALPTP